MMRGNYEWYGGRCVRACEARGADHDAAADDDGRQRYDVLVNGLDKNRLDVHVGGRIPPFKGQPMKGV